MHRLPLVLAVACAAVFLFAPSGHAAGPDGYLTQIPGTGGCIVEDAGSPDAPADCTDGRGLVGTEAIVLSSDERFAYVYSYDTGSIAILSRDAATGALSQADGPSACVQKTDADGCTDSRLTDGGSDSSHAIALSGSHLFAVSSSRSMIGTFQRDAVTGTLTDTGGTGACVSKTGADADQAAGQCTTLVQLGRPQSLAISPDGKFLYASGLDAVGLYAFSIDGAGALTPLAGDDKCHAATDVDGCTQSRLARSIYDITLSADGGTLYAANVDDAAVVAFTRNATTGALTEIAGPGGCVLDDGVGDPADPCTAGRALETAQSVELSPDGKLLTVSGAGDRGIAVLRRAADGSLSQGAGAAGCVTETGADGCGTSSVAYNVYRTLFSPDGTLLFAGTYGDDGTVGTGIGVYDVGADGTLTQRPAPRGCVSTDGTDAAGTAGACDTARGVLGTVGLAATADGRWLYAAGYSDNAVAGFKFQRPPTCTGTRAVAAVGMAVTVPLTCTNADGDPLTLSRVDGPAHGSVAISGSSAVYTPTLGYVGADSFRFKASDGIDESAPATVAITVVAIPTGPPAKVAPLALSARAKPKRDRTLPYKFTFRGRLTPAAGATCSGEVVVTLKRGRKRVARKRAALAPTCTYRVVVTIKNRRKLGRKRSGKLTAKVRYTGNTEMLARTSRKLTVRYGKR